MNNCDCYLSVIIPAYNESMRLGSSLKKIKTFLLAQSYSSEIIVVDDGSQDATVQIAEEMLGSFPHKILKNQTNKGKGFSVRQGMLAASGKYLLFSDADLSTPIEESSRFLKLAEQGYDCIIGSRAMIESQVEIRQNFLRELMGKIFNRFAKTMSFKGIRDSQCGFKCFSRKAAMDLFKRQKLYGFSFDAEILYLAQKLNYRILETPVIWRNSPQSRVRILIDPIAMFLDLLRIRWLHRNLS